MNGFTAILRHQLTEIRRTWRLWVVPGFLLLQAVSGPVTALFNKQLVASMVSPAMAATMPDPTFWDSWAQWAKNLTPTVALVVIVTNAGLVASEVAHSTAVLVLTKPVSRRAFVLAKFVAAWLFLVASTTVMAAVTAGLTMALFPDVQLAPLVKATASWLVLASFLLAAVLLASCVMSGALGAAGIGLGALLVVSLMGLWGPLARHSMGGLPGVIGEVALGHDAVWGWPVGVTVAATAGVVWLACEVFHRREI